MRIVNIPRYYCEVCNMQFIDSKVAREHEDGCRREAFLRGEVIGRWVSKDGKVLGIACMTRSEDAKVGVMDPLKGSVGWYTPSTLKATTDSDAQEHLESVVGRNIGEAMAKARGYADADR